MKALRNLMLVAVVVGTMAMMSAWSFAGPLPGFPGVWNPGDYVMGQSTLGSTVSGYTDPIYDLEIDWIVMFLGPAPAGNPFGIPVGTPVWGYYYQIENSSTTSVGAFTITTPGPPFVAATSVFADLDLGGASDPLSGLTIPGHTVAGETEAATLVPTWPITGLPSVGSTSTSYSFLPPPFGPGKLPSGYESEILIAYAIVPPTYGNAGALDDIPPSPWSSISLTGEPVPVPSPEPTATMLLGIGALLGAVVLRRRK